MTVKSATDQRIDLTASSRRVAAARVIAERQARIVASAGTSVDRLNVDLLFLTQETVLVLDETHRLLVALSAKEGRIAPERPVEVVTPEWMSKVPVSRRVPLVFQVLLFAIIAAFAVEIVDPAPMDVFAFHANLPVSGP